MHTDGFTQLHYHLSLVFVVHFMSPSHLLIPSLFPFFPPFSSFFTLIYPLFIPLSSPLSSSLLFSFPLPLISPFSSPLISPLISPLFSLIQTLHARGYPHLVVTYIKQAETDNLLIGTKAYNLLILAYLKTDQFSSALDTLDRIEREHYKIINTFKSVTPSCDISSALIGNLYEKNYEIDKVNGTRNNSHDNKNNINSSSNKYIFTGTDNINKTDTHTSHTPHTPHTPPALHYPYHTPPRAIPSEVPFGSDLSSFVSLIMSPRLHVRPRTLGQHSYSVSVCCPRVSAILLCCPCARVLLYHYYAALLSCCITFNHSEFL